MPQLQQIPFEANQCTGATSIHSCTDHAYDRGKAEISLKNKKTKKQKRSSLSCSNKYGNTLFR